ncbi:MAG: DegT/DnrJ/EryC1/StrS family aminotransferase [Elusimicrobiota bacterium]
MKKNIPWAKPVFYGKEKEYLVNALESTWISDGYYVERFEKEFAEYHKVPFGITVSNGTAALQLAVLGLGLSGKDEVIVPGFSFFAAANMVLSAGAVPVFADIDPDTWCLDISCVERAITEKTRAVIAVHNYGNVCDMAALIELAGRHDLCIIEDCAEAVFSKYMNKLAGTFGDAGCFSFQATKTITTGEGGIVVLSEEDINNRMRLLRNHGMSPQKHYWPEMHGYNFRMTNLQAAVGCAQFECLDKIIKDKQRIYSRYLEQLGNEAGVTMQMFRKEVDPVVWTVALRIDKKRFVYDRDGTIASLLDSGIETRPGFYPYSIMPIYKSNALPNAEAVSAGVICLPSFCTISDKEIEYICDKIKKLKK